MLIAQKILFITVLILIIATSCAFYFNKFTLSEKKVQRLFLILAIISAVITLINPNLSAFYMLISLLTLLCFLSTVIRIIYQKSYKLYVITFVTLAIVSGIVSSFL